MPLSALMLASAWVLPAQAIEVEDPGSYIIENLGVADQVKELAQGVQEIETMHTQLEQLQAGYQAISNVRDLGSAVGALGVLGIRNPLPVNPYAVQSLMNGSGGIGGMSSNLGSLFSGTAAGNQVYTPDQSTWLGSEIARNGSGIAGAQAMALQLYQSAADRMAGLDSLRDQVSTATDPATRESLIAQISSEQSAIANQQVQAASLGNYMAVQIASQQQRVIEKRQEEIDQVLDQGRAAGVGSDANTVTAGGN